MSSPGWRTSKKIGLFVSVITFGELRRGVDRLPAGRRRDQLDGWVRHDLPSRFEGRVLMIDSDVADAWGTIVARRERSGRPITTLDAFIAATAHVHGLTLVTRNASDFKSSVTSILNPWT